MDMLEVKLGQIFIFISLNAVAFVAFRSFAV